MKIICPECRTVYRIDENKIPTRKAKTRCKKCGGVITIIIAQNHSVKKKTPSTKTAAALTTSPAPATEPSQTEKTPASVSSNQTKAQVSSAGRRFPAFLVDAFILLLFTQGLFFLIGLVLPAAENWQFSGGFILALIYFGLGNSAVFKGRTIGKRIMGIRAQNGDGSLILLTRSVLRALLMIGPLFLALLIFPICELGHIFVIIIFAILLSTILFSVYLFLFNTRTRQSVHDLIMRTYVVMVDARGSVQTAPFWKWHAAVAGVLMLVISLAVFFVFPVGGFA